MEVVPLLVFCSLALAAGGVLMFIMSTRLGDHEHAERLSLLPLEDDVSDQENSGATPAFGRDDGYRDNGHAR
jgi:hypothetical protein